MAGNLRRVDVKEEPWRLKQLMDEARGCLLPWTPELEKAVRLIAEQDEKHRAATSKQKSAWAELQAVLQRIMSKRATACIDSSELRKLSGAIERARVSGVEDDSLREAEGHLADFKRVSSQRQVAEHRLHLALNAKDLGEIERASREVEALGCERSTDASSPKSAVNRARTDQPRSTRLTEAANAMIRHLGDVASRKQAAEAALLQQTSSDLCGAAGALPSTAWTDGGGTGFGGTSVSTRATSKSCAAAAGSVKGGCAKGIREALHDARQNGVAPSLIEHARVKARQRQREQEEHERACKELQKTLANQGATTQELLRIMRRVQRCRDPTSVSDISPASPGEGGTAMT